MIKYLIILLLTLHITILGQISYIPITNNSTQVDTFANLGESVNDLFIDPEIEGRLVAVKQTSDYIVKFSTDNGVTWSNSLINTSYPLQNTKANSIALNFSNLDVGFLAAGYDLLKTSDRGETWDSTNMFTDFFDIYYVVYHPLDSGIVFVSNFYSNFNEVLLYRSDDGGTTWSVPDSTYYTRLVFHPDNSNIIFGIADHSFINKSVDGGKTWENSNNNLGFTNNKIRVLELRKDNPDILYCGQLYDIYGSDNWILSITTDGGESWERIDSTLKEIDPEGSVYSILLDQNREGRFYVSYTGGLFLTEDNGKHFQKIYSGEAGKIWSDRNNPPNIYFNSDRGLLRILDTVTVGVKRTGKNIPTQYILNQNYPNPFNPSTVISFSIPKQEHVTLKIYDTLGKEMNTLLNETKSPGKYEIEFDASELSSGVYFYSLNTVEYFKVRKMILLR